MKPKFATRVLLVVALLTAVFIMSACGGGEEEAAEGPDVPTPVATFTTAAGSIAGDGEEAAEEPAEAPTEEDTEAEEAEATEEPTEAPTEEPTVEPTATEVAATVVPTPLAEEVVTDTGEITGTDDVTDVESLTATAGLTATEGATNAESRADTGEAALIDVIMHDIYFGDEGDNLTNPPVWTVPAGSDVQLILDNEGALEHNWAIVQPGAEVPVPFVEEEEGSDELLLYNPGRAAAGETLETTFEAPDVGTYTVICTVAGHYPAMQGQLVVE